MIAPHVVQKPDNTEIAFATPLVLRAPSGSVELESNLMLAPIAGWCEHAWRVSVRRCGGVALACTDLLSPQGLICGSQASTDLAHTSGEDSPIGMQLYGSDPDVLARGAQWCAEHGATVVDINMGCPVDKVCKKDGGSRLMCDLDNTFAIFERVRGALPKHIPLTAKMRLGWDDEARSNKVASTLSVGLCERGAACITVHGRTTAERFKGSCDHDGIRRVVEDVAGATGAYDGTPHGGVPVLGNGDVKSAQDVVTMRVNTGCAGVMIGRGAFGNPWVFRQGWALQQRIDALGIDLRDPELAEVVNAIDLSDIEAPEHEKLGLVSIYFEQMILDRGEAHAMHVIRQKISWLGKSIRGGHCKALKEDVRTAGSPDEVRRVLRDWAESTDNTQTKTPSEASLSDPHDRSRRATPS